MPNVVRLIRECQNRSVSAIFTRFLNMEGSPFETLMGWQELRSGPDTDIADELADVAHTVVDKNFYSAFTNEFRRLAALEDWKTLLICGIATESCVAKTAVDAFEQNLRPIVVSDACASDAGDEAHQAGLLVLRRFIGKEQIMTLDDVLLHLDK